MPTTAVRSIGQVTVQRTLSWFASPRLPVTLTFCGSGCTVEAITSPELGRRKAGACIFRSQGSHVSVLFSSKLHTSPRQHLRKHREKNGGWVTISHRSNLPLLRSRVCQE